MTFIMLLFIAPTIALLQNTPSISYLSSKHSLHRSKAHNLQSLQNQRKRSRLSKFSDLRAAEDDEDELSSNFLNFLKKTKESEEEDDDEEEITENVAKTKQNIFKEIASGGINTIQLTTSCHHDNVTSLFC